MNPRSLAAATAWLLWLLSSSSSLARQPFAVVGSEGGGSPDGVTGWLLGGQSRLTHLMADRIHELQGNPHAAWGLVGLGLIYGVFHAAGPGHGKAVIASYMLANERSLKRGAALALMASLLQAAVAVLLVVAAVFFFQATASGMTQAARAIELASYTGIAAIGLWLSWRKGSGFIDALQRHFERSREIAATPAFAGVAWAAPEPTLSSGFYAAAPPGEVGLVMDECGHTHAPDPSLIGDDFSWRLAAPTIVAAGVRAVFGGGAYSSLRASAGAVCCRDCGDVCDGARCGLNNRRARLARRLRQSHSDAICVWQGISDYTSCAWLRIRRRARRACVRRRVGLRRQRNGVKCAALSSKQIFEFAPRRLSAGLGPCERRVLECLSA